MAEIKNPEQQTDKPSVEKGPEDLRQAEAQKNSRKDDLSPNHNKENTTRTENPEQPTSRSESTAESTEQQRKNALRGEHTEGKEVEPKLKNTEKMPFNGDRVEPPAESKEKSTDNKLDNKVSEGKANDLGVVKKETEKVEQEKSNFSADNFKPENSYDAKAPNETREMTSKEQQSKSCLDANKISEIQSIEKGQRPNPETYMSKEQINAHLDQFKEGGSFVMTRDQYETFVEGREKIGLPDNSQYMTSKEYMDSIDKKANGDIAVYEKELGFDQGHFENGGGMVRVDVNEPLEHNARMPSGNEMGANDHFVPGGYTDGGAPECVTNQIPNNDECRKLTFF